MTQPDRTTRDLPSLGYLANTYPLISTTFVRREIEAHEEAGHPVKRYAIRPWSEALVDPADINEQRKTTYLLGGPLGGLAGLLIPTLKEMVLRPIAFARAARTALTLSRGAATKKAYYGVWLMEACRLRQLTRTDGIDHLHAHFSTNAATVALLSRRLGGPSYSFTVHGPDELPGMAADGIREKTRHATFVAAITRYCQRVVTDAAGSDLSDKVRIVGCGVETPKFDPESAMPPGQSNVIVCVGRLCAAKDQPALLRAALPVFETDPDLHLLFIGDGDKRTEMEELIETHALQDKVTLHGWGTGEEVLAALRKARALALPSHAEGLPVVIMEAMALARPVISTRIAGIPELLDDSCGWIVEPGDVTALTQALRECLSASDPDLTAMGTEGRARVLERHDQSTNAGTLRRLIAETAGAPEATP